jgi:iron complex transport system substrate-binding protein
MFSKQSRFLFLLLALFLIPLSGMAAQTTDPIVVTDALEREVTFDTAPQRIVVTGKALFMIADAIYAFPEASSRIVAIGRTAQMTLDFIPAIDPNYADKTIIDGQAGAEEIAANQPDLVLLKSISAETLGGPLEALGIPVVYLDFENHEQYVRDLTTLGLIFQDEERAQELITFFQDRIDMVTGALESLTDEEKPRTLLLYYSDKNGTIAFNVPPVSFIQTWSMETAGGMPVWLDAELGNSWTTVTLEQIAAWDPDQIYIVSYFIPAADVISTLEDDPQWQALRATGDGKLYGFPADYYSWDQPDPRWILGLEWLAKTMHPEQFEELDMQQEIRSFYADLYNMDDEAYAEIVEPNLPADLP